MRVVQNESRCVLITGGASGLGLALAAHYLRAGWRVAVADHDAEVLARSVAGPLSGALALDCDVRVEADLIRAREQLLAAWGRIDLLVNNAGVAVAGRLEDCAEADWQWIVDINLLGVVRGCRAFLPQMRAQGHGQVVNVASLAGLIHPPLMAAYCATKAAVVALSEVLEAELAGSGVAVSVVCPGFFRTGLARTSRTTTPELRAAIRRLVAGAPVSAERVAAQVAAGIAARRFLITTHRPETLLWMCKRLLPHALFLRLMVRLMAAREARAATAQAGG